MNWFYESAGQQQGPVNEEELDRLLAEGKITPTTLVWREGLPDWQPMRVARPREAVPPPINAPSDADIPAGHVRCTLTGKIIPESEAVYIQGKPYSAEAKPQVLHALQSGNALPLAEGGRTGPAWERRAEIGFFRAIGETISGVLLNPSATFASMRREGGLGTPLLYQMVLGYSAGFIASIYGIFFNQFTSRFQPAGSPIRMYQLSPQQNFAASVVALLIGVPLMAFVLSGITHLCLMMFGGARRDFETTFRVGCYTWGSASVFYLLPGCGGFIAMIWGIVAMCIGLAAAHETTTGKAVGAVLTPIALCCGALVLLYTVIFALIYGAMQSH